MSIQFQFVLSTLNFILSYKIGTNCILSTKLHVKSSFKKHKYIFTKLINVYVKKTF